MTHLALVTGANRGIGLGLVREFLGRGWRVIATCRAPQGAAALQDLSRQHSELRVQQLDVTKPQDMADLVGNLGDEPIDLLINNAGVFDDDRRLGALDYDTWRGILEVNLLGQVRVTEALLANVLASDQKKVVAISSALGSISQSMGGRYAYRSSKAALNMVFHTLARDLSEAGAVVAILSPGLVDTDLTRKVTKRKISVEESARGLANVIVDLTVGDSGSFFRHDGGTVSW